MMKRGKHIIRNYMTLSYDFTGIRLQDSNLTPVDWQLKVNLVAHKKRGVSEEELEYKTSALYQRLYFWLDTNLPNIIAVDVESEPDLYIANLSSNIMMYCPGNPGDDLIIQLLHSKLTALTSGELVVGEIKLTGSDTTLEYTFDCEDGDYGLPTETKEYYTEGTARDEIPWWSRNDGFCFEFIRPEKSEDVTDEELFGNIQDPMLEFEKLISEISEGQIGVMREPARIVQVEKWKPKKVE